MSTFGEKTCTAMPSPVVVKSENFPGWNHAASRVVGACELVDVIAQVDDIVVLVSSCCIAISVEIAIGFEEAGISISID